MILCYYIGMHKYIYTNHLWHAKSRRTTQRAKNLFRIFIAMARWWGKHCETARWIAIRRRSYSGYYTFPDSHPRNLRSLMMSSGHYYAWHETHVDIIVSLSLSELISISLPLLNNVSPFYFFCSVYIMKSKSCLRNARFLYSREAHSFNEIL